LPAGLPVAKGPGFTAQSFKAPGNDHPYYEPIIALKTRIIESNESIFGKNNKKQPETFAVLKNILFSPPK
jgi:hypothetical protein